MPDDPTSRLRELRDQRGLSQIELAAIAGLTRQSVGAIEAGRATPSVTVALRIARALECRVEDLFGEACAAEQLVAEPVRALGATKRLALAFIAGRWVSFPLARQGASRSADALSTRRHRGRVAVELLRSSGEARDNVILLGCAPALGLLADRLNARRGPGRFLWFPWSSTDALDALAREQTHVAGVHLVDAKTGEANTADVRRRVRSRDVTLVTLARWEVGLVVAAGNPRRIRTSADLGRRGVRLVAREAGAGARRLLDGELRRAGLPLTLATSAAVQANGHLDVAHAVALGAADVGCATRDAAQLFGLDFLPLAEERFDLAIPSDTLPDPRLSRLVDTMTSAPFRQEISALGYDASACGARVAELRAPTSEEGTP